MVENGNKDEDLWNTSYNDIYDLKPDYSGLSKEFRESEKLNDDPYWEKKKSFRSVQTHEHRDSDWVMQQHKEEAGHIKEPKKVSVRLIICVIFLLMAIVSVACAYFLVERAWQKTMEQARGLAYSEEEVGDAFACNDYNQMFLEEHAYTVVTGEGIPYFPLGQKLIAVYVEVESERYVDGRGIVNVYAGFDTPEGEAYTKPGMYSATWKYLSEVGFRDSDYLFSYGIGNGIDQAGYYFFFVPEDVGQITFYMEQREEGRSYGALQKVFYRKMTVLPCDEELTGQLVERGESMS